MATENRPELVEITTERLNDHLYRITILVSVQPEQVSGVAMAPSREAVTPEAVPAVEAFSAQEAAPDEVKEEVAEGPPEAGGPVMALEATEKEEEGKGKEKKEKEADPREKLKETMMQNAAKHNARLRALLDKVPPEAREALLQAIFVSDESYEEALESLEEALEELLEESEESLHEDDDSDDEHQEDSDDSDEPDD
jgi:hypothetical protein